MKILGIDPGSRNCGYAIIEANKGKNTLIEA
ncbi:TPA: crossover junction endodeoxyribonuclease RuvC, partial [Campylobacter coli]|nr:crossover junction endodeoxyribonuclease RuvC [Campylobacter coli]